jgi:hypothetical protein
VLARIDRSAGPTTGLVLDEPAQERLLALLAAAYGDLWSVACSGTSAVHRSTAATDNDIRPRSSWR